MATQTSSLGINAIRSVEKGQRVDGLTFDWIMVGLSIWFIGGLFIDGWAHATGHTDNTFFTPWHAIFYSGFMANVIGIAAAMYINHSRGYDWDEAIPLGYRLSLVGIVIFAAGGVFDLIWHTLFGIEANFEALISPSHLILGTGLIVLMSGPLRAAWQRTGTRAQTPGFVQMLPTLLSLTFTYSILTFFSLYFHPFINPSRVVGPTPTDNLVGQLAQIAGVTSFLLQAIILASFMLLVVRRWKMPFGSFTLIMTINMAAMQIIRDQHYDIKFVIVSALTGLLADVLVNRFDPSAQHKLMLRFFAFIVPTVWFFLYFIVVAGEGNIWWTTHVWAGSAVLGGVMGLLLSYVFLSPLPPTAFEGSATPANTGSSS